MLSRTHLVKITAKHEDPEFGSAPAAAHIKQFLDYALEVANEEGSITAIEGTDYPDLPTLIREGKTGIIAERDTVEKALEYLQSMVTPDMRGPITVGALVIVNTVLEQLAKRFEP